MQRAIDGRMRAVRVSFMPWRSCAAYQGLVDRLLRPWWVQNMVDGREGGAVGPFDRATAKATRKMNADAYGIV